MNSDRGFSLVQVMIVGALLAGLSVVGMKIMKSLGDGQNYVESGADEIRLENLVNLILSDLNHCTASFKDYTFKKRDIDFAGAEVTLATNYVDVNEGQEASLWYSKISSTDRAIKKLNGDIFPELKDKSQYGKLRIKSIRFLMNKEVLPNTGAGVGNYSSGTVNDNGQLVIRYEKKISSTKTREEKKIFDFSASIFTGAAPTYTSQIISCSGISAANSKMEIIESSSPINSSSLTGSEACQNIGKSCVNIISHNFVRDAPADSGHHGERLCKTAYFTSLEGIPNGDLQNNIHSCSAKIGEATTYLHVGILRCNAIFSAICN